jgi:hypothetical protein
MSHCHNASTRATYPKPFAGKITADVGHSPSSADARFASRYITHQHTHINIIGMPRGQALADTTVGAASL